MMTRYYFPSCDVDTRLSDKVGIELPSADAARDMGLRVMLEMVADAEPVLGTDRSFTVEVRDGAGGLLCLIRIRLEVLRL